MKTQRLFMFSDKNIMTHLLVCLIVNQQTNLQIDRVNKPKADTHGGGIKSASPPPPKKGCICLLLCSPSRAFSPTSVHWRCLGGTSEDTFLIAFYLLSGFPLPLNIWPRPGRSVAGVSLQMFPSLQPPLVLWSLVHMNV